MKTPRPEPDPNIEVTLESDDDNENPYKEQICRALSALQTHLTQAAEGKTVSMEDLQQIFSDISFGLQEMDNLEQNLPHDLARQLIRFLRDCIRPEWPALFSDLREIFDQLHSMDPGPATDEELQALYDKLLHVSTGNNEFRPDPGVIEDMRIRFEASDLFRTSKSAEKRPKISN